MFVSKYKRVMRVVLLCGAAGVLCIVCTRFVSSAVDYSTVIPECCRSHRSRVAGCLWVSRRSSTGTGAMAAPSAATATLTGSGASGLIGRPGSVGARFGRRMRLLVSGNQGRGASRILVHPSTQASIAAGASWRCTAGAWALPKPGRMSWLLRAGADARAGSGAGEGFVVRCSC